MIFESDLMPIKSILGRMYNYYSIKVVFGTLDRPSSALSNTPRLRTHFIQWKHTGTGGTELNFRVNNLNSMFFGFQFERLQKNPDGRVLLWGVFF